MTGPVPASAGAWQSDQFAPRRRSAGGCRRSSSGCPVTGLGMLRLRAGSDRGAPGGGLRRSAAGSGGRTRQLARFRAPVHEQGGDGECGGGGQGDEGGELVAPAEFEGVPDQQDGGGGGEREQAGAGGVALGGGGVAAGQAEGAGQPGQGHQGEQRPRGVAAAELV